MNKYFSKNNKLFFGDANTSARVLWGSKFTKGFINLVIEENKGFIPPIPKGFTLAKKVRNVFYDEKMFSEPRQIFIRRKGRVFKNGRVPVALRKRGFRFDPSTQTFFKPPVIMYDADTGNIQHAPNDSKLPLAIREFTGKDQPLTKNQIKNMIASELTVNGTQLLLEIPPNKKINVLLRFSVVFSYAGQPVERRTFTEMFFDTTPAQITNELLNQRIRNKYPFVSTMGGVKFSAQILSTTDPNDTFQKVGMKLRQEQIQIFNQKLNKYKLDDAKKLDDNCVKDYLLHHWKNMSKKTIKSLGDENGVSVEELFNFCQVRRIKMIAYDINGNVLREHQCKSHKKHKAVFFIAYNNHIYPLTSAYLADGKNLNSYKIVEVDNGTDKLKEFLNNNILPSRIKGTFSSDIDSKQSIDILSFVDEEAGIKYLCNDQYFKCKNILTKFGLADKLTDGTRLTKIGEIIEELYTEKEDGKKVRVKSFWPECSKFVKSGYNYHNHSYDSLYCATTEQFLNGLNVKTIDKNKSYSYSLKHLPYLITFDYRQSTLTTINKNMNDELELVDEYLYIASPKYSSLLMENESVFTGKHLNYCFENGLEFFVREEMTTNKVNNVYRRMVDDIYEKVGNNKDAKDIVNFFIGKMEREYGFKNGCQINNVYSIEEGDLTPGCSVKITDDYVLKIDTKQQFDIYNSKPISIQIKDHSKRVLFEKMKTLDISQADIVQIKTDSITAVLPKIDLNFSKSLEGWKEEKYVPINDRLILKNEPMTFKLTSHHPKKRTLYQDLAGKGKTYHTLNKIIPDIQARGKSYIVLTPSHSTKEEYMERGITCEVFQKFTHQYASLPKYDVIICDEIGMFNRQGNDMIYMAYLTEATEIISLGDYEQLLPVGEDNTFNSKQYLKFIYNTHKTLGVNRRNNFTDEYYKKLQEGNINLIREVKKYSCSNWYDADRIICYRNETAKKYNQMYIERLGHDDMFFIGAYLVCKTNDLRKDEIFNNFFVDIVDIEGDHVLLSDGNTYTKDDIKKYFKLGYSSTLYGAQGKSIKSIYYAPEDYYWVSNNSSCKEAGRNAYTFISRLKTK